MTPPPISRAGLARCPSCLTHVAVAREVVSTVCPFCGASFGAPSAGGGRASSSALVAALGLGIALTGCGAKTEPTASDPGVPAARAPAPPVVQPAVYGGPPRDEGPPIAPPPSDTDSDTDDDDDDDTDDAQVAPPPAPRPGPIEIVPLYGVAPVPVPVPVPPVQDKPKRDR